MKGVRTIAPHPEGSSVNRRLHLSRTHRRLRRRRLFKTTGKGVAWDFGLGVIGAVLVGSLFSHIAATGAAGLNTATALVAALTGAAALLATFHGLRDTRYRPGDPI